jgi:hypothetical protein
MGTLKGWSQSPSTFRNYRSQHTEESSLDTETMEQVSSVLVMDKGSLD